MSDEAEFIFEKLNIMKEIWEAAVDNLELRKELTNSIDSIQRFLDNRTSRLSLHNQNFKSALPAKDEDMKYFFEVTKLISFSLIIILFYLFQLFLFYRLSMILNLKYLLKIQQLRI